MQLTDIIAQMGGLQSVAKELGVSESQASAGAAALLPAILGGFKKQAQAQPTGLDGLGGLLSALGGSAQLGQIVRDLSDGARSEAERRLLALLREAGCTGWVANQRVRAGGRWYILDVAFPAARLAIEVDGRAFHSDARAFQHDRTRQNDLVAAGWTVLRFTWADLVERPEHVLEAITTGLTLRRGA